jgi:hypothetical protein
MKDAKMHPIFNTLEISGGTSPRTKRFLKGNFSKGIGKIGRYLSYTTLKSYGAFLLSFGLLTLFLNLGKYYVLDNSVVKPSILAVGIFLSVTAIPLLFFDKPMCIAMQDFALTDYLFFEFLSIKRMNRIQNPPSIPIFISIFFGMALSLIGFFVSLEYVLVALLVLVTVVLSFTSLEFPMILTLLLLPYCQFLPYDAHVIGALSILSFLGYFIRVLLGKRSYHLNFYGVAVFLFGVFILISGLIQNEPQSARSTWLSLALLLGYYPATGLVVNRRLADSALKAVVFATLPLAVYTLVNSVVGFANNGFRFSELYYGISSRSDAGFVADIYLLISAIFTLMFFFQKNQKVKKAFYAVFFAIDVLCIAISSYLGIVIALILALILALITFKNTKAGYVIFPITLIPYLILLLPVSYLDKISQFLRLTVPLSRLKAGLLDTASLAFSNAFSGVGLGAVPDTFANLCVELFASAGVFALVILLVLLAVRFIQTAVIFRYVKYSSVYVASTMSTVSIGALVTAGAFGPLFAIPELLYIFFVIFGISESTLRVAKKESDDRLNYYGDARSSEASAVDINIA